MLRAAVALCAVGVSASVTFTVKLIGPVTLPVGVPVIAPVPPFNVKPAGSAPTLIDQAYGVMPPVAPSVWLYAVPSVPPGSVAGVIFSVGALIAMPRLAPFVAFVGVWESVTVAAKFDVPVKVPVGVPEITPALLKLNPAGKLPV
jgi:hypothetical protein